MRKLVSASVAVYFSSFAFLFAQAVTPTTQAETANLVANSSFEEGQFSPTNFPAGWLWDDWAGTALHTWSENEAKAGARAYRSPRPA